MSRKQHEKNPGNASDDIIIHKFPLLHLYDARYDWRKCPDDGQKSGEYDGLSAMFIIKCFCIVEVLFLE